MIPLIGKSGVLFLCILNIIAVGKSNAVGKDTKRAKIKLSSDTNNREDNLYGN